MPFTVLKKSGRSNLRKDKNVAFMLANARSEVMAISQFGKIIRIETATLIFVGVQSRFPALYFRQSRIV